jgi:hypothetical protein
MKESLIYFSEARVQEVAQKMKETGRQYEQLFTDLGRQMFADMVDLHDVSEMTAVCTRHIDQALSAFTQYFPDVSPAACTKGCCHCCFFPVECPPQVVIDIARYLRSKESAAGLDLLRHKLAKDMKDRKPPLYRAKCPFLNDEKLCSIYEKRPLACQCFTSPDPAQCKQSVADGRNISQHPLRHRIYQVATTMLLACAKAQDRPHDQVLFIPSLLAILEIEDQDGLWQGYGI